MTALLARLFCHGHAWGTRLKNKAFSWAVAGAFASFGRRSVIALPARLDGVGHIRIGEGVFLGPGCWLNALVLPGREAPEIAVGDGVSVTGQCVLSAARQIVLEDRVLVARNAYIADHGHAYQDPTQPILAQGVTDVRPVRIRAGAWLGQNVVVCPGVTIGRNAVIGANSVVRSDVPDFAVAVGAPARVVRRFNPANRTWERV